MSAIKKIVFIMLSIAIVILSLIGWHKWQKSIFYEGEPVLTDAPTVLTIYQLMYDVDNILTTHNIPYWLDFGSLLGAVRHQGLIPWDDDLDISIEIAHEDKLKNIFSAFNERGYGIIPTCIGYKIFPQNGIKVYYKDEDCRFPFMDVYMREWHEDKLCYIFRNRKRSPLKEQRDGKPIYSTKEEIYPLKKYTFGALSVTGPHNPFPHLKYCFGEDWNDIAYQTVNHRGKLSHRVKKKLTSHDKQPALPLEPIKRQ